MEKIAIITDSASDLSQDILDKYNVKVAPFRIIYSTGEYEDGIDITSDEVYANLETSIPTTSLPNTERVSNILDELENEGYTHIISINISSALSGTSNAIRLLLEDRPNLTSFVYDTKTLTMAEGSIVISACKMIEEGKSFNEIIAALPDERKKLECYFTLGTLEYLKKGGRIGKVSGTIGEILNLKPIIHVGDDGVYHTHTKVRGTKQSISKLALILEEYLAKGDSNVWIVQGAAPNECQSLVDIVKDNPNIVSLSTGTIGPSLGVHTGPGLFGFIVQKV